MSMSTYAPLVAVNFWFSEFVSSLISRTYPQFGLYICPQAVHSLFTFKKSFLKTRFIILDRLTERHFSRQGPVSPLENLQFIFLEL